MGVGVKVCVGVLVIVGVTVNLVGVGVKVAWLWPLAPAYDTSRSSLPAKASSGKVTANTVVAAGVGVPPVALGAGPVGRGCKGRQR